MESPGLCKEMEQFPTDLTAEIFSRLPSKSVARFCTLSKHWASTLRSPDFAELFLARSSTRPRLLFAVEQYNDNKWQFFSTPQPKNQNEKLSHVEFHSKFSGDVSQYPCSYASGLFLFSKVNISDENVPLICNPVTGLYVRLPHVDQYRESPGFLGFDPIDKEFKVIKQQHCILTLGTGELIWRHKKTVGYLHSLTEGISINGILYFLALKFGEGEGMSLVAAIVCCDVRTEEFSLINAQWFDVQPDDPFCLRVDLTVKLVNYMGKLGGIDWKRVEADGRSTVELCMWVLEDFKRQEWVKYVYTLPENEVLTSCDFSIAGVTSTGEIVLVMKYVRKPFYVFYYNPERNTLQSVEIQGFGAELETAEDPGEVHAIVDYVEDLSVNNAKQLTSNISHITPTCPCCKEEAKKKKKKEEEEEEAEKEKEEEEEEEAEKEEEKEEEAEKEKEEEEEEEVKN